MLICRYCLEELKSRGEKLVVTDDIIASAEDVEDTNAAEGESYCCEWCGEIDDLYGVWFR